MSDTAADNRATPADSLPPAMRAVREIRAHGPRFGKAGAAAGIFLNAYVQTVKSQSALLAEAGQDIAAFPEEQSTALQIAEGPALERLVAGVAPKKFEAAISDALADRFEAEPAGSLLGAANRGEPIERFATALGIRSEEIAPGGPLEHLAQRNALLGLKAEAIGSFFEHIYEAHKLRTTDRAEMTAVATALRERARVVASEIEGEAPPAPGSLSAGVTTVNDVSRLAQVAMQQTNTLPRDPLER